MLSDERVYVEPKLPGNGFVTFRSSWSASFLTATCDEGARSAISRREIESCHPKLACKIHEFREIFIAAKINVLGCAEMKCKYDRRVAAIGQCNVPRP